MYLHRPVKDARMTKSNFFFRDLRKHLKSEPFFLIHHVVIPLRSEKLWKECLI